MTLPIDAAGSIRDDEAIDRGRLAEYLRQVPIIGSEAMTIQQFRGGHSNLTYLVTVPGAEYVLRRPPFGNTVKGAHDMGREFRVLAALAPVFPPAPRPVAYCEDESVIGAPFYLMERRRGAVIRTSVPPGFALTTDRAGRICGALVDTIAQLHQVDVDATGLAAFGRPEGYVSRQVAGWSDRYRRAETEPVPAMNEVSAWLAVEQPGESGAAIIHNDFKFDNLILAPDDLGQVVAVLDWEMATIGDPLMDLGTALAYWVERQDPPAMVAMAMGPTTAPGMWTRRAVLDRYQDRIGTEVKHIRFYFVFGLFKLGVILQQLHARYVRGATRDARFASMNRMVRVLAGRAAEVVAQGLE